MVETQPHMSAKETATYLGVSLSTFYNWRSTGTAPKGYKYAQKVVYKKQDIDTWLSARKELSNHHA